mgnify:CR=1 FL=1
MITTRHHTQQQQQQSERNTQHQRYMYSYYDGDDRYEGEPVGQPEYREHGIRPRQLTTIYVDRAGTAPGHSCYNSARLTRDATIEDGQ